MQAEIEYSANPVMVSSNKSYSIFKLCFIVMINKNFTSLNIQV